MRAENPYSPSQWRNLIPNIDEVIAQMEQVPILSVGITPYTRIIPSFFLKNYSIYTIKRSSDVDLMEGFLNMYVFEDHHPDIAKKVHGTGYLIGNYAFQNFLKSRRREPTLMFYTMTDKIIADLDRLRIKWIGNHTSTFKDVMYKGSFRELVRTLGLPSLDSTIYARADFLGTSFELLWKDLGGAFVVQRADKETGGNEGTFFIHTREDFERCTALLHHDQSFERLVVTPFIKGHSTSMLGCVTSKGVLSGPLQLQLIDVPESLHHVPANGIFFGNDIGFHPWGPEIEAEAQKVVEGIGKHLASQGYRGIFGIDLLYDAARNKIFPNECNPRFTGSLVLYSLMLLEAGVPPMEFFHLLAHFDIEADFDFEAVNAALKTRIPSAHIAFSPKGIPSMELPLVAGVYAYDSKGPTLSYKGPGISLADLKTPNDFLLVDTVPKLHESLEQNVPRLFKFIFKRSIAKSSYEIDADASFLLSHFSSALIQAAQKKNSTS